MEKDLTADLHRLKSMKMLIRAVVLLYICVTGFDCQVFAALKRQNQESQKSRTPSTAPSKSEVKEEKKAEPRELLKPRRWPVQILSATYGTGGKNADVTVKVKDYVENLQRPFSSNPPELGADPNPGWNKNLRIIYMKDGVRREQNRNENEHILPESFYGPHDTAELKAWLPASRWAGAKGEIQFHADGTFTSPGMEAVGHWQALGAKKLRLTWSEDRKPEFVFDHTWTSFSEVENGKNVFHVVQ